MTRCLVFAGILITLGWLTFFLAGVACLRLSGETDRLGGEIFFAGYFLAGLGGEMVRFLGGEAFISSLSLAFLSVKETLDLALDSRFFSTFLGGGSNLANCLVLVRLVPVSLGWLFGLEDLDLDGYAFLGSGFLVLPLGVSTLAAGFGVGLSLLNLDNLGFCFGSCFFTDLDD